MTLSPARPTREPRACSVDDYRELMSSFPTGVAIVTAVGPDGTPLGMTCSSLISVTLVPPTLLLCLTSASRTTEAALASGSFAVNLLHARARGVAKLFATPGAERFANTAWQATGPDSLPHLMDDAFAIADCRVARALPVGDHTLLIGAVDEIEHRPDQPLLYGLRTFASWPAASAG